MSLNQILQLKDKKFVYIMEENDSTYIYRKEWAHKYALTLISRRECRKRFRLNPIIQFHPKYFIFLYKHFFILFSVKIIEIFHFQINYVKK